MSFVSEVKDGKINIPPRVNLPEAASVRVEPLRAETLATRLKAVIGSAEGLPPDFAAQHDHYLYGTPKK
jgi:hypothetical protein